MLSDIAPHMEHNDVVVGSLPKLYAIRLCNIYCDGDSFPKNKPMSRAKP